MEPTEQTKWRSIVDGSFEATMEQVVDDAPTHIVVHEPVQDACIRGTPERLARTGLHLDRPRDRIDVFVHRSTFAHAA